MLSVNLIYHNQMFSDLMDMLCCLQRSKKSERIQEIWEDGVGVVSLHIFQNTIPVEAWTREAAMISAIGKTFYIYSFLF